MRDWIRVRNTDTGAEESVLDVLECHEVLDEDAADRFGRPYPSLPTGKPPVELYDPATGTVDQVVAYLDQADDDERARVIAAEAAGQARKTIAGWAPPAPAE